MIIDAHVHLLGALPENGCHVSGKLARGATYHLLTRAIGLSGTPRARLDDAYADRLIAWARGTTEIDAIGVLAFDGVYDAGGRLRLDRTSLMVSNDYCFRVCRRAPQSLIPIASINPRRRDAIDELERVAELGAAAIKTLPNSQDFDPGDRRHVPFWQKMAALEIPLLTHTSFEHTVPPIDQEMGRPERLVGPLEQGVHVIAAHCAGSGVAHPFHEDFDTWLQMCDRHTNLWGDISAMASISRFPYIHRVLESDLARSRVILGSDYPVPAHPQLFTRHIGLRRALKLAAITNPFQKNLLTFRALGVDQTIEERAASLLNMSRWSEGSPQAGAI